jgi:tRNA(Glu) U13 pseudouridine synthase TruD
MLNFTVQQHLYFSFATSTEYLGIKIHKRKCTTEIGLYEFELNLFIVTPWN